MKDKIPEWIAILLAFHKSGLYKIENEIRFLRFYKIGERNFNSFTLNYKFEKTFYDKLLIKTRDNLKEIERDSKKIILKTPFNINDPASIEEVTKQNPFVEIEKIIIGYRHIKNFKKLKKAIQDGFIEKNGYGIGVELSALSSAFA
jgi:hypothetical protein